MTENNISQEELDALTEGLELDPPTEEQQIVPSVKPITGSDSSQEEPAPEETPPGKPLLTQEEIDALIEAQKPPENKDIYTQDREKIIQDLSSSVKNAREKYPEQLQALREERENTIPIGREEENRRNQKLEEAKQKETELAEKKENLLQEKKASLNEKKELEKKNFVFFRGKKIENANQKIEDITSTLKELREEQDNIRDAKEKIQQEITLRPELQPLKKKFKELMPLLQCDVMTPEQKKKIFTEEFLSTLNTEEYLKIWRLGSPHYVAHVTRQGIIDRANTDVDWNAGLRLDKQENGLKEMLADNKSLKSSMLSKYKIDLSKDIDEESEKNLELLIRDLNNTISDASLIDKYFQGTYNDLKSYDERMLSLQFLGQIDIKSLDEGDLSEEILKLIDFQVIRQRELEEALETIINPSKPYPFTGIPYIADKSAIHLSSDEVLDRIYGCEVRNEIFVIFPSDLIASQTSFGIAAFENDLTKKPSTWENKWNDLFVWKKNQSLNVDAGVIFLPLDAEVNPNTGSKYEIENGERKPSSNTVNSKEYWEKYFEENPTLRPQHIVYYESQLTPTQAVESFLEENNIIKLKQQLPNLGFQENLVVNKRFDKDNETTANFLRRAEQLNEKSKEILERVVRAHAMEKPINEEELLSIIKSKRKNFPGNPGTGLL